VGEPHSVKVHRLNLGSHGIRNQLPVDKSKSSAKVGNALFDPAGLAPRTHRNLLAVPSFSGSRLQTVPRQASRESHKKQPRPGSRATILYRDRGLGDKNVAPGIIEEVRRKDRWESGVSCRDGGECATRDRFCAAQTPAWRMNDHISHSYVCVQRTKNRAKPRHRHAPA
jgi:hypothetical protein